MKSLERNVLGFVGIHPIRRTLIGSVDNSTDQAEKWIKLAEKLGAAGN